MSNQLTPPKKAPKWNMRELKKAAQAAGVVIRKIEERERENEVQSTIEEISFIGHKRSH